MLEFDPEHHPHRRYNPLADSWVLVSPHRTQRPWQGATEQIIVESKPNYDPTCYLCPGNERANGEVNPVYDSTFVFRNDFAALLDGTPSGQSNDPLFRTDAIRGECRVICFSPRHDLTLATMSVDEIVLVIRLWQAQLSELGSRWNSVQIFENRGEAMGASNPHPHGQIWANDGVPTFLETESRTQKSYGQQYGKPMLLEVAERESDSGERTVVENEYWIAVVPFWAVWPFETLLLPKFELKRLEHCHEVHVRALAQVLSELLRRYDALFGVPFPYSMGWHVPPYHSDAEYWISHAHFYPPLLRSASVRKFMVGYELLAESQRDLTPEKAAARLREVTLGQ